MYGWIRVPLTGDAALVLSDWIYELQNGDRRLEDLALWPALYAIDGAFARKSALIFSPAYGEELEAARARIAAGTDAPEGQTYAVELTEDQAVVLAAWLRGDGTGADGHHGPVDSGDILGDAAVDRPLRQIGAAIEAKGVDGLDLSAARRRLLFSMGLTADGVPLEEVEDCEPA